jgi:nucleotide-binding universal stress UspA family protein
MKILIATDGSERSRKALDVGIGMARALGAGVIGLTVVPGYRYATVGEHRPEQFNDFQARNTALANDRLAAIEHAAAAAGVACEVLTKEDEAPHRAILDVARDYGCDFIVLASHGRGGAQTLLLGSETQKVLALSDRPVLVAR